MNEFAMVIHMHNLFLTGRRHVGKSTIIQQVLLVHHLAWGGFTVATVYSPSGEKTAFVLNTASGEKGAIAAWRDGMWNPCPEVFETIGVKCLADCLAKKLAIMDELGRFELAAPLFQQKVYEVLDSPVPVLGVLQEVRNAFLDAIRHRPDVAVLTVTPENRENVLWQVQNFVQRYVSL